MADKSYGQFGTFKWQYIKEHQHARINLANVDATDLSSGCLKDIKYFLANAKQSGSNQIVNYTWEKAEEESPSIFQRHEIDDKPEDDKHKNTMQLMEPYKGFPHAAEQNKWEAETGAPPVLKSEPMKRRTAVLSTMTRYAEEMNLTFPGFKLY